MAPRVDRRVEACGDAQGAAGLIERLATSAKRGAQAGAALSRQSEPACPGVAPAEMLTLVGTDGLYEIVDEHAT